MKERKVKREVGAGQIDLGSEAPSAVSMAKLALWASFSLFHVPVEEQVGTIFEVPLTAERMQHDVRSLSTHHLGR